MRWDDFELACPEIASPARARFEADEVLLVGTIRRDGSPRISPNEVDFAAGRLLLGMMWRSRKALDLLRDPRVVVHSTPHTRLNPGGDVKLYGRALDEPDPDVREAYGRAIEARIGWRPDGDFHLFSLDVGSASYVRLAETGSVVLAWDPQRGLRELPVPG